MQQNASTASMASSWRVIRRLFPVYVVIARQFRLAEPPCKDLRDLRTSEPEAVEQLTAWFDTIDDTLQPHQLRQVLQHTTIGSTEEKLSALVERHLRKSEDPGQRDKLDFLLTQYVSVCAPPVLHQIEPSLEDIAHVLEPVLGEIPTDLPRWLSPLDELINVMRACNSLRDVQQRQVLERGRELKANAGEMYFGRSALLAFARFNFLVRQNFFRLLHADVQAVENGLKLLEERNVQNLDCTSADLSNNESIANLQRLCENWKRPEVTEYTHFQFQRLLQLRQLIDAALAQTAPSIENADLRLREMERRLDQAMRENAELRTVIEALGSRLDSLDSAVASVMAESEKPIMRVPIGETAASAQKKNLKAPTPPPVEAETSDILEPALPKPNGKAHHVSVKPNGKADHEHMPDPAFEEPAVAEPVAGVDLTAAMAEVQKQLQTGSWRKFRLPNLNIAGTTLLLTVKEVEAFTQPETDPDGSLRGVVAAKVLLVKSLEERKSGTPSIMLRNVIEVARGQMQRLESAAARSATPSDDNGDGIATAMRQLKFLISQAEGVTAA